MKHFEFTYSKGHLIDTSTGKRIFLKRGATFTIQGDNESFTESDSLMEVPLAKSREDKLVEVVTRHGRENIIRLAKAGQQFVFRVGINKRTEEDKSRSFWFLAGIAEDLFMYKTKSGKWQLEECLCETVECLEGELQMYEPVFGTSLSNLFSNVVAFYFTLQRSGAANAFTTFYYLPEREAFRYVKTRGSTLDHERKKVIRQKEEGTFVSQNLAI